jgi:hypothetical protein
MDFNIGRTPGRLYNLVCAVAAEEITMHEFRSAVNPLAPESIQYVGTILAMQASLRERPSAHLSGASAVCRSHAVKRRLLN